MSTSLPDIYIHYANGLLMLQGASQAAIEFRGALLPLTNGTTALVAPEAAEDALSQIQAAASGR